MRYILILAFFTILLVNPILADLPTKYSNYEVSVKLSESQIVEETIDITFPESVDGFNIYLIHQAKNLEIFARNQKLDCDWKYEGTGTLISCKNFNSTKISLVFDYIGFITHYETYMIFSDRYVITTPIDNFTLKVFLPKGYILSESIDTTRPSYYPVNGVQKTDGKTIYVEWNTNPKLGEVFDVAVYYEKALRTDQFMVIISTLIVMVVMVLLFIYFKRQPKIVDVGLTEDEKKVLNVIIKGNKVSQKKIVRETGFSKAQVSRIAKALESRGLIERKRVGRNYEIVAK